MSAMASPFKVPEDPQASAERSKETPHIKEPPGCDTIVWPLVGSRHELEHDMWHIVILEILI